MHNLIITVIALAIMAAVTATNLTYTTAYSVERNAIQQTLQQGMTSMVKAVERYIEDNTDLQTGEIYLDQELPGFVEGVNMLPLIIPAYGFMPAKQNAFTWSMETQRIYGMDAVAICVTSAPDSSPAIKDSLAAVAEQMPEGSAFLSTGCGATTNAALESEQTHLTRWVVLAHVL